MVMPSNNTGSVVREMHVQYPGRLGLLMSPGGLRRPPPGMRYALDNGAFSAWSNGTPWDEAAFRAAVDAAWKAYGPPLWVTVPDVVADRSATLARWDEWADELRHIRRAFVVQDGMDERDVPQEASVVFVGGTTEWKRATLPLWCRSFRRVHVGRINTERWLWVCHDLGAESCDGTGWLRGDKKQLDGLRSYLEMSSGMKKREPVLFPEMRREARDE